MQEGFLFAKLKKIKEFLNRYAMMVMKNEEWRDIERKLSFFFASVVKEKWLNESCWKREYE